MILHLFRRPVPAYRATVTQGDATGGQAIIVTRRDGETLRIAMPTSLRIIPPAEAECARLWTASHAVIVPDGYGRATVTAITMPSVPTVSAPARRRAA